MTQVQDTTLTVDEFLASPLADEEPSWEYLPGGVLARKVSPSNEHGIVQAYFAYLFIRYRQEASVSIEVLTEGRAVFPHSSLVPDMTVYAGRLQPGPDGRLEKYPSRPPTVAIEILSPGQTQRQLLEKCRSMIGDGPQVGLVVDPYRREVLLVLNTGTTTYRGDQVIPLPVAELAGLHLTADEIFSSLL